MLFIDHQERIRLHTRGLILESGDLSSEPSGVLRECMPESLTFSRPVPQLISVPAHDEFPGGVFVIGGAVISFYEAKKPKSAKKKGKKAAPKQRHIRITNTHLKGTIDLSRDYVPPGTTAK